MSILSQTQPAGKPKVEGHFSTVEDPQTHMAHQRAESVSSAGVPIAPERRIKRGSSLATSMGAREVNRPTIILPLSYNESPSLDRLCKLIGQNVPNGPSPRPAFLAGRGRLDLGCDQPATDPHDYSWLRSLAEEEFEKEAAKLNKDAWLEKKLGHIDSCGRRVRLAEFSVCHQRAWFPIMCHTLGCPTCTVLEAKERQKEYGPIIDQLASRAERAEVLGDDVARIRFLTFTVKNFPLDQGAEMVDLLLSAFTRLKDLRFGPRIIKTLEKEFYAALTLAKTRSPQNANPLTDKQAARQIRLWEKFKRFFLRKHGEGCKNLKLRHFSKGIARLEWLCGKDGGHHFHLHSVWSTQFPIPQVLLEILWKKATGCDGRVDIRATDKDLQRELIKYISKPWDMSREEIGAVLLAVRNRKKIWIWGFDAPEGKDLTASEKAEATTDHCSNPSCKLDWVGFADLDYRITLDRISALRNGWIVYGKYHDTKLMITRSIQFSYSEMRGFVWQDIPR